MNDLSPTWSDRLFVGLQYLLPQHLLSALMYRLARIRWRPLSASLIRVFVRHFRVDMTEALEPNLAAYTSFNAFFTRALRRDARPQPEGPQALACPADGGLSQLGAIEAGPPFPGQGAGLRPGGPGG